MVRKWPYLVTIFNSVRSWLVAKERGVTLIETLVAMALLGTVGVAFLSGLGTANKTSIVANEQAIAESLVRSEIEYVKKYAYQYDASQYPVNPELTIPQSWSVPPPVVEPVHATDDGIQKVTVTAERNGETMLSIVVYKVDR